MSETIQLITQGLAYPLKCFVINSVAAIDETIIEAYGWDDAARAFLSEANNHGGTSIIGPGGNIIAGPLSPARRFFMSM